MGIRFGVCASYDKIPELVDAGYDYIEGSFSELAAMPDAAFARIEATFQKYHIMCECCNLFFPGSIRITGPEVDFERIAAHCEKGMRRAAALGCRVAVIGSGGNRRIPDGFDPSVAYGQLVKVLTLVGDIAGKYCITVALEPLNREETNLINTVAEGIAVCREVNRPNVKTLADFYHVYKSGESLDAIRQSGGMLGHLHLARANNDRRLPCEEDIPQIKEWVAAVREAGYGGRLSLEGNCVGEFSACIRRARRILDCFQ